MTYFALLGLSALFAGFVLLIYLVVNQFTYWKRRKLSHLIGVPLIGYNAPIYFRYAAFPENVKFLYNLHPNTRYYGTFDFNTPVIVLKDPDLIHEVCVKNFANFPDHRSFVSEEADPIVGRNIFSLKGQRWREVRSTLSPSFSSNRMKIMFQLIDKCSQDFVQYFLDHPEMAENFEAKDAFTRYANDVIATAAFGIEVNSLENRENEFYVYGKDAVDFSPFWRLAKMVLMRCFPKTMHMIGEPFMARSTDHFFKNLVSSTVTAREKNGIVRPDMIQLMMQARDKKDGIDVTLNDIIGQAFIFFLAGFETASTLICYVVNELAAHPNIQEKLQQEIQEQLEQENGEVTYETIGRMKYLDRIINETLRLYPPAPMIDRVCTKEFMLPGQKKGDPGYRVEVGTNIVIPIYGLHHDPEYFSDPEKFMPERFDGDKMENINPYVYMPFGAGPRKCIGFRFALMETKTLLVHILNQFNIRSTEQTKYPVVFAKKTFNMNIEGGFCFKLERRKNKTI